MISSFVLHCKIHIIVRSTLLDQFQPFQHVLSRFIQGCLAPVDYICVTWTARCCWLPGAQEGSGALTAITMAGMQRHWCCTAQGMVRTTVGSEDLGSWTQAWQPIMQTVLCPAGQKLVCWGFCSVRCLNQVKTKLSESHSMDRAQQRQ